MPVIWERSHRYLCLILTIIAMICFSFATFLITFRNRCGHAHIASIVCCNTLCILYSCCIGTRTFARRSPSSKGSSHIVSLYRQIVSRTSCSSPLLSATFKSPLRKVPSSNSQQSEWIGRVPRYVLNIVHLSSRWCSILKRQSRQTGPCQSATRSATLKDQCTSTTSPSVDAAF